MIHTGPPTYKHRLATFLEAMVGKRTTLSILVLSTLMFSAEVHAQTTRFDASRALELLPSPGILRNGVSNLNASGDSLWVGPFLNLTTNGGQTWLVANADSLAGFRNRAFSIDSEGATIWAGLGIRERRDISGQAEEVDLARGFHFSEDGGQSWQYRTYFPPDDNDPTTTGILDLPDDTLTVYGDVVLPSLAITVPEASPPWDVDYDPLTGTVWTASQLAGIRKSKDNGRTWQRVVLPPDTTKYLSPDLGYVFPFFVQPIGIPLEQFAGLNFQAFSVLVDRAGEIWTGTVGGLNHSTDEVSWHHFTYNGTPNGLPGNWVISIEEQPLAGQPSVIWAACWPALEQGESFGVAVTQDGGETFEQLLVGERVFDFAFRGETAYVAGENGLFISEDGGVSWRTIRDFRDATQPDRTFRPGSRVLSVATTNSALWVGTDDGLFRSTDNGVSWRLFRAEVPLNPDGLPPVVPAESVPRVDAYAYPNPFSPAADGFVRLRYKLDSAEQVKIRIFDFGMNLVRTVADELQPPGEREVSWDGTGDTGARVANGPYFYVIQTGNKTFRGKILVLE